MVSKIIKKLEKFGTSVPRKKPVIKYKQGSAGVIVVPKQKPAEYKAMFFTGEIKG